LLLHRHYSGVRSEVTKVSRKRPLVHGRQNDDLQRRHELTSERTLKTRFRIQIHKYHVRTGINSCHCQIKLFVQCSWYTCTRIFSLMCVFVFILRFISLCFNLKMVSLFSKKIQKNNDLIVLPILTLILTLSNYRVLVITCQR